MDSPVIPHDLPDQEATEALGARLGALLRPGDVVTLTGPLGAGKTTLARAAIRARLKDPDTEAPSPTFTLVQTYMAPDLLEIWHIDLYRLNDAAETQELGLEDVFGAGAALIEWPDRLGSFLPTERLDISLTHEGEARRAVLAFHGPRWGERIEQFR